MRTSRSLPPGWPLPAAVRPLRRGCPPAPSATASAGSSPAGSALHPVWAGGPAPVPGPVGRRSPARPWRLPAGRRSHRSALRAAGRAAALRRRLGLLLVALLIALLAGAGLALVVRAAWIPAKAALAQVLLARAWERAVDGEERPRPWPWADTWPVGRLTLPGGEPLVVLAGASGRTLAFAPGHVDGTARPGEAGNVVLAGHRDTHFRRLEGLRAGDALTLEDPAGGRHHYRVTGVAVLHHTDVRPLAPEDRRLTLVTCWPFEALHPGGPLRYVVTARREAPAASPPATPGTTSAAVGGLLSSLPAGRRSDTGKGNADETPRGDVRGTAAPVRRRGRTGLGAGAVGPGTVGRPGAGWGDPAP